MTPSPANPADIVLATINACGLRPNIEPTCDTLHIDAIPFADMQRLKRFAQLEVVVVNRGNWPRTAPLLWQTNAPHSTLRINTLPRP